MSNSENLLGADNQQGSPLVDWKIYYDPSETTRRAPIIAFLKGAMHDGTYSKLHNTFRFSQKEKDWLLVIQEMLAELNYKSWLYKEGKHRNTYVLETSCNLLHSSFDSENASREEKIAFVRGFFDSDGSLPLSKNPQRLYAYFYQKDYDELLSLKRMLNTLGIKTGKIHNPSKSVDPNYFRLSVLSKSIRDFYKIVGSHHLLKVNAIRNHLG